jgi:oligopeptide transport system substrate-binding protein
MKRISLPTTRTALLLVALILAGCTSTSTGRYFGSSKPAGDNVLRYISGSEPASLDPHISGGQPEARIYGALYEGLVDYHPKTLQPIPALAERWEISPKIDEFIFHLRKNGKFSDGKPITAHDFVYSFRRGFNPEVISQTVSLGYFIKYAEAFNGHQLFVKRDGKFVSENDVSEEPAKDAEDPPFGPETEFHKFIKSPARLTVPDDPLRRAQLVEGNPKLKEMLKFRADEIKDPASVIRRLNEGTDPLSQMIAARSGVGALKCGGSCGDQDRQSVADGLNKAIDAESFFYVEGVASVALPEPAAKLAAAVAAENKKRTEANVKIDEEIAKMTDSAKITEKEKSKRKPLGKLTHANRFILEQLFPEEIGPVSFVPVAASDIGVEAIDEYTLRITLRQPAPFFLGLLTHQFFRVVPSQSIENHGKNWTRAQNIVTSGQFRVREIKPYDKLVVERDPNYWDRDNVHLDAIEFYMIEELTTTLNLYKSGAVDAVLNHAVPSGWIEVVSQYKDEWMNLPESATAYYSFNMKKPPFDNPKVRQAFALALDREALSAFRKITKPLYYYSPSGIFPDYDRAMAKVGEEIRLEKGLSPEEWSRRKKLFDPELARKLLTEAGFPVTGNGGKFECPSFPTDKVALTFNKGESNQSIAEFIQAQWARNLGITVPLQNQEFRTFLADRNALRYDGLAQSLWSGDYMDPYTFLGLHYGAVNDGGSGFADPKYDKLLDDANAELDPQKRYELMARAEHYLLEQMPAMPLTINATNWVKKPWVKGMYPNPGSLFSWKFVYLERDPAKWDTDVNGLMERDDPKVVEQIKKLEGAVK